MLRKDGVAIGVTRTAIPNASGLRKADAATRTAARPTRLWNAATSCGIAVMAMRRAITNPMPPPIPIAATISGRLAISCVTSVVTTAISMPAMPKRFPRWLVEGEDRPRSARMKHTPATR